MIVKNDDRQDFYVACRCCGEHFSLNLSVSALQAWQNGELIQNAMPELSADERELLISHTCGDCWEKMFS